MTESTGMNAHDSVRTFSSGAVRDGGQKPALELISPYALMRLGEWLRFACEDRRPSPYPKRNWEKGMPFSSVVASLERHIQKFKLGDTSEDHVAAILFGGMVLAHFEEEIKAGRMDPTLDDMPHYMQRPSSPVLGIDATKPVDYENEVCADFALKTDPAGDLKDARPVYFEGHKVPWVKDLAKPFTVYLCGPITGQLLDYTWRDKATEYLGHSGIRTLNPLRGKNPKDVSNLGLSYKGQLAAPEIAERDRLDIEEADVIFAHFPYLPPRQSIGSLMEMGAAAIGFKKPVILCTTEKNFTEHLFCRNFCTLEPDFNQALRRIEALAKAKGR